MEYHKGERQELTPYESQIFEDGPVSGVVNRYAFSESTIEQHIVLLPGVNTLYFHTRVNWHENDRMLRVEFSPSVWGDEVICEIQNGEIRRTTHDESPVEKTQFEICARRYVTVYDGEYGFSLINDCKYGLRAKNGMISLNMLRSTSYPDESADRGEHEFIYAFVPHRAAERMEAVRLAHNLNRLPFHYSGREVTPIVNVSGDVVADSVKESMDGKGIVVRLYEPIARRPLHRLLCPLPTPRCMSARLWMR
ncbi:MAG: hypothetical protein MR563_08680 [Spirochaetales bacterium]|nr:hypothetical protein [Spirochaetales bacterium]